MAGITKVFLNGCFRLFRTFSYRDANNRPQHNRKSIGRIDPITQKPIFNSYFLNLIRNQNISIEQIEGLSLSEIPNIVNFGSYKKQLPTINSQNDNINSIDANIIENDVENLQEKNNNNVVFETITESFSECIEKFSVKNYGSYILLSQIISQTGLLNILNKVFPDISTEIITLAYFLVCTNKSVMHCYNWIDKTVTIPLKSSLQSQRISELFSSIKYNKIMEFYELWAPKNNDDQYLALDITSISSYSNLIHNVEHGYNRDHDKLAQINLCLLFGEKSGLPIYSSMFSGSINDVCTLPTFIEQIEFFSSLSYKFVMDKGFYSKNNINILLKRYKNHKFLISVPFTTSISRQIISDGKSKFDRSLALKIGDDILDNYSFIEKIDNNNQLIYFVFYNARLFIECENNAIEKAILLKENAIKDPQKYINDKEYKKYLKFTKDKLTQEFSININIDRINFECRNKAWLIIVSNDFSLSCSDVINIYRNKDVVEKAFCRLKNQLGMKRTRVHNDVTLYGKLFIAMISLIINSYINNILKINDDLNFTITGLIDELDKIQLFKNDLKRSISPISKSNRQIFEAFGIKVKEIK